jgi:ubiquinone/menaquinone biosynthesis C-methylase UbiE
MTDLFPPEDFDEWAESYDQSVTNNEIFPFTGYNKVLAKVVELVAPQSGMQVLDLGIGTGNLALRFERLGCEIWGTDFSTAMLEKARTKLPKAHLFQADLRGDWPLELNRSFDHIVSAYVFHHFELGEKVQIVELLVREHLKPGGSLIVADIAFQNPYDLEEIKRAAGDEWEDEFYWLADEAMIALKENRLRVEYTQVSTCAGIFVISPD